MYILAFVISEGLFVIMYGQCGVICYYVWTVLGYLLSCMGSVGLFVINYWEVLGHLLLFIKSVGLFVIMYG